MINLGYLFSFRIKNLCCGHTLEAPHRGASNEYQQRIFFMENWETISLARHQIFVHNKFTDTSYNYVYHVYVHIIIYWCLVIYISVVKTNARKICMREVKNKFS